MIYSNFSTKWLFYSDIVVKSKFSFFITPNILQYTTFWKIKFMPYGCNGFFKICDFWKLVLGCSYSDDRSIIVLNCIEWKKIWFRWRSVEVTPVFYKIRIINTNHFFVAFVLVLSFVVFDFNFFCPMMLPLWSWESLKPDLNCCTSFSYW